MLTEREIKLTILNRLEAATSSCNSYHINHVTGVIRGLLWALTGNDPGNLAPIDVLKLANIPHRLEGDMIYWDTEEF